MKAKQGKGFEGDYEKLQKYLGPGKVDNERGVVLSARPTKLLLSPSPIISQLEPGVSIQSSRGTQISASEFARDMAAINATYIPSANKSGKYLKIATNLWVGVVDTLLLLLRYLLNVSPLILLLVLL